MQLILLLLAIATLPFVYSGRSIPANRDARDIVTHVVEFESNPFLPGIMCWACYIMPHMAMTTAVIPAQNPTANMYLKRSMGLNSVAYQIIRIRYNTGQKF